MNSKKSDSKERIPYVKPEVRDISNNLDEKCSKCEFGDTHGEKRSERRGRCEWGAGFFVFCESGFGGTHGCEAGNLVF